MQRIHISIIQDNDTSPTVVTLSDDPTNGGMIKAMFPTIESRLDERTGIMLAKWADGTTKTFKADWWNSPYKRGTE